MVIRIVDMFNPDKVWVIKVTKCKHYYYNQEIKGRMFYPKFQRISNRLYKDLVELAYKHG